jgi:serine/threonine-protein kinase
MSPEQARGELDIDARTDIWALGVIMYEALTGEIPFDANNYNALMLCIITRPHKPVIQLAPEVPLELSQLIDQVLQKDRDLRVGGAGDLADRLERIYARMTQTPMSRPERPLSVPPPYAMTGSGWHVVGAGRRSVSMPLVLGATLALVGVIGGGIAVAQGGSEPVVSANRMGGTVSAVAARAQTQFAEAVAAAKAKEADDAARDARRRAEESKGVGNGKSGTFPVRRPQGPNPVHGGVDGPGF